MKKRHFFHLGFLCLIVTLFCSLPATSYAGFATEHCVQNTGIIVTIQGLTSTPIELEYPEEFEGTAITLTIYLDGEILYQETTYETTVDYASLELPDGEKSLVVQVAENTTTIVFW